MLNKYAKSVIKIFQILHRMLHILNQIKVEFQFGQILQVVDLVQAIITLERYRIYLISYISCVFLLLCLSQILSVSNPIHLMYIFQAYFQILKQIHLNRFQIKALNILALIIIKFLHQIRNTGGRFLKIILEEGQIT